ITPVLCVFVRVVLVESKANLLQVEKSQDSQENLIQQFSSRTNHSSDNTTSLSTDGLNGGADCGEWEDSDLHCDPADECGVTEFFSPVRSVSLAAGQTETIELHYLPFHLGKRHCSVLLVSQQVGEQVYLVEGTAELPLPSPLTTKPSPNVVHVSSATSDGADPRPAVNLRCGVGSTLDEVVCVPLVNGLWERALATVGQQRMSPVEKNRRNLTHTLDSSTVRAGVAAPALTASQVDSRHTHRDRHTHTHSGQLSLSLSLSLFALLVSCLSLLVHGPVQSYHLSPLPLSSRSSWSMVQSSLTISPLSSRSSWSMVQSSLTVSLLFPSPPGPPGPWSSPVLLSLSSPLSSRSSWSMVQSS
uniref:Uncharacterized protein n=1 Tax=Hucho hucho TaxID=62062 RepID=A0A4W5K5L7_9TELE